MEDEGLRFEGRKSHYLITSVNYPLHLDNNYRTEYH